MALSALAFLLIVAVGIVHGLTRQPAFALLAYIVAFYANPPSRWWAAYVPDLRWALLTGLVAAVAATIHKSRLEGVRAWHADSIFWLLVLFVAYWWLQLPWVVGREEHIDGVVYMSKYLIVLYVVIRVLDEPRKFEWLMLAHIIGCAYLGVLARSMSEGSGRLDGVGGPGIDDANTLGMMFATALMVGATQVLYGSRAKRIVVLLCLPLILNGLILTQSRGAFLGLMAGGIFLLMRAPKVGRKVLLGFGALGIVALGVLAHEQFWERIGTITAKEEERDFSAASRLVIIEAQVQMFRDYPMGTGSRGTAVLSTRYLGEEYLAVDATGARTQRSSHNTIMTVVTEHGVIGAALYAMLMAAVLSRLWRLTRELRDDPERAGLAYVTASIGAALAVVFVAGQFADYLRAEVQIWMLGALIAMTRLVQSTSGGRVEPEATQPRSPTGPKEPGHGRPRVPTRALTRVPTREERR